ncbi:MAG: hypothetical protein Q8S39_09255, partial [Ignavibacteria bacterium]|nr:hypothetical protein [Ignavibacteria bacterium]
MNKYVIAVLLLFTHFVNAQNETFEQKAGRISFVTSQNIYVRFESTNGINKNDTLYLAANGKLKPAIVVQFVSSSSCSGVIVTNYQFKVED